MNRIRSWLNEDLEKKNPKLIAVMTFLMVAFSFTGVILFFSFIVHIIQGR